MSCISCQNNSNISYNCQCSCNSCTSCYNYTSCCKPEVDCEPCANSSGCPVNLDTKCVFYNLSSSDPSGLICMNLPNGTSLTDILEEIDTKLCQAFPDIAAYDLPCLRSSYTILNFQDFAEAVDYQLCYVKSLISSTKTSLEVSIGNLSTLVTSIYTPDITDCGDIGLDPGDTIIEVLQKYADKICEIVNECCGDNSPNLNTTNSSTLSFVTSGTKNHNLTGSVKVSSTFGNLITVNPDGLYCTVSIPSMYQTLSYNSGTNTLSISNGNSVVLGSAPAPQTLTFDCVSMILGISDGNTVDLSCIASGPFVETPLVANDSSSINFTTSGTAGHILTGSVIISPNANNILTNPGNGLYVPAPTASTDQYVKLNSGDPSAGYLEDKIIGVVNSLISTTVTSNNITHQAEVEAVLDVEELLDTISTTPAYLTAFCNIVKACLCFKFRIINTDVSSQTYEYTDCNGVDHAGLSIGAGSSLEICGTAIDVSDPTKVTVQNLGYC